MAGLKVKIWVWNEMKDMKSSEEEYEEARNIARENEARRLSEDEDEAYDETVDDEKVSEKTHEVRVWAAMEKEINDFLKAERKTISKVITFRCDAESRVAYMLYEETD